jgi:hypothetical protein
MFFFKWYGGSSNLGTIGVNLGSASANGWDTFTNSRWIWLMTVIVALGAVVLVAGQRKLDGPVQPSVIVTGLAALSTLLILYRIVHHPTASVTVGNLHASVGIKIGIWLGLIAAAAITYGGYLQMRREGTSLSDVRDQAGGVFRDMTSPQDERSPSTPTGSTGQPAPPAPPAPPGQSTGQPAPPAPPAPPDQSAGQTAPPAPPGQSGQPPSPPAPRAPTPGGTSSSPEPPVEPAPPSQ